MFAAVLDPLHRPPETQRRERTSTSFGIELAADAEAAADMALFEMDGFGLAAEHPGEIVARAMRHLGSAVKFEHIARRVRKRASAPRVSKGTPE